MNSDNTKHIFESPDGGNTVYRRKMFEIHDRKLINRPYPSCLPITTSNIVYVSRQGPSEYTQISDVPNVTPGIVGASHYITHQTWLG